MNFDQFNNQFKDLRDVDKINVDDLCDHPEHVDTGKQIAKGAAKRNILKHGGKEFICRACEMRHNNPMTKVGQRRQTDEEITVYCPHPEHEGDPARRMKKACYYGEMAEPYLQVCGSCAERGKIISDEQRENTSMALEGRPKSDEFKASLNAYWEAHPERRAEATATLLANKCTTGMLDKHHSEEMKEKMSQAHSGKKFSDEHRRNISKGRKQMLAAQGGFSEEHLANITSANRRNGVLRRLQSRLGALLELQHEIEGGMSKA